MQIIEFDVGTLRFLDQPPSALPERGFVWIWLDRETLEGDQARLQQAAQALGGSPLLDLHLRDLANPAHPSSHDDTSVYDLVIFRRLATELEVQQELGEATPPKASPLGRFARVRARAMGFAVFERLLVTVHPKGSLTAQWFVQRYLADAVHNEGLSAAARSRLPVSPADLMLRMLNTMVDSYLDLRKELSSELDQWQHLLLGTRSRDTDWEALLTARNALHTLEDLCEEQNDAMQEWLDCQHEQPAPWMTQAERDALLARARDVVEHIGRVVHHVRRMEQSAETAVQIHFSALGHRTNETMRTLTALTAVFLPLNLIAGIFGMNFEFIPLLHTQSGFWWAMGSMTVIALALAALFWRKRYLSRSGR